MSPPAQDNWILLGPSTSHGGPGSRDIAYRGSWERIVHGLIIAHLGISVIIHLWAIVRGDHEMFRIFPYQYSVFAVAYFAFFAWRQWTVRLEGTDDFLGRRS